MDEIFDFCLYHAECSDGACAAWLAFTHHEAHGHVLTCIPVRYGDAPPAQLYEAGSRKIDQRILIVDFSYDEATLLDMALFHRRVVVLDHHGTAKTALKDLVYYEAGEQIDSSLLGGPHKDKGLYVEFNMEQSGAEMTGHYLWDNARPVIPPLVQYVSAWDLWEHDRVPHCRAINQLIQTLPREINGVTATAWDAMHRRLINDFGGALAEGQRLEMQLDQTLAQITAQAFWLDMATEIGAVSIPVVECSRKYHSEVGHKLLKDHPDAPFAATYLITDDGWRVWSLRSDNDHLDVSVVARLHGGGGHRNAASWRQRNPE